LKVNDSPSFIVTDEGCIFAILRVVVFVLLSEALLLLELNIISLEKYLVTVLISVSIYSAFSLNEILTVGGVLLQLILASNCKVSPFEIVFLDGLN
jgi:hypothetical protein